MSHNTPDWYTLGVSLGYDQSIKVTCCGKDASAYVKNTSRGVSFGPCFRCGGRDFRAHEHLTLKQRISMRKHTEDLRGLGDVPGVPLTQAPPNVWAWCGAAGLSPELLSYEYRFRWSDKYQRIIIPIVHKGIFTDAFVARSLQPQTPKYINSKNAKGLFWSNGADTSVTFIVEDVLSAIKIDSAGYRVIAAMGTSAVNNPVFLNNLLDTDTAIIWMDDDPAGHKARKALSRKLPILDISCKTVVTAEDPKFYSVRGICRVYNELVGRDYDRLIYPEDL